VPKSAIPSQSDNAAGEPTFAQPESDIAQVSREELYEKATKYTPLYADAVKKDYMVENAQLTHERKALEDTIGALRASLHEHTTELDELKTELALLTQEKNTMLELLDEIREGYKWLASDRWQTW
jgi:DNA repair exonuclease SbcCD ATPase subunit